MNQIGKLLIIASLVDFAIAASAVTPVSMVCVAEHPAMQQTFLGEGYKWIAAHAAVESCTMAAKAQGLDASECRISRCEPNDFDSSL